LNRDCGLIISTPLISRGGQIVKWQRRPADTGYAKYVWVGIDELIPMQAPTTTVAAALISFGLRQPAAAFPSNSLLLDTYQ
ncbi:MAG: hypothetical protein O3C40_22550, partial [Planctomycetota bacterium]|nr:hypothetical protein [Planctomycetota bacterium]